MDTITDIEKESVKHIAFFERFAQKYKKIVCSLLKLFSHYLAITMLVIFLSPFFLPYVKDADLNGLTKGFKNTLIAIAALGAIPLIMYLVIII